MKVKLHEPMNPNNTCSLEHILGLQLTANKPKPQQNVTHNPTHTEQPDTHVKWCSLDELLKQKQKTYTVKYSSPLDQILFDQTTGNECEEITELSDHYLESQGTKAITKFYGVDYVAYLNQKQIWDVLIFSEWGVKSENPLTKHYLQRCLQLTCFDWIETELDYAGEILYLDPELEVMVYCSENPKFLTELVKRNVKSGKLPKFRWDYRHIRHAITDYLFKNQPNSSLSPFLV